MQIYFAVEEINFKIIIFWANVRLKNLSIRRAFPFFALLFLEKSGKEFL